MTFVTDEMVRAAAVGMRRAQLARLGYLDPDTADILAGELTTVDLLNASAALEAASVLWLAHVQRASEHTADYQMAEAAAAELRRLATTDGGA